MSIAVLRTFISKRKQEQEAMLSRRKTNGPKVADEPAVEQEAVVDSARDNGKLNEECEFSDEKFQDEPCSISQDNQEGNGPGELKPPRVLEVINEYIY